MATQYYALVAGLKEFTLESENKGFDAKDIVSSISDELTENDRENLALFYTFYDVENILSILAGRSQFNTLGNFTREELTAEIKNPSALPEFLAEPLRNYVKPKEMGFEILDTDKPLSHILFEAFYNRCARSDNKFIRQWYEFDRNLRNTIAAYTARKAGLPVADSVVGEGYVADNLVRSSAADFGLRGELDYMDVLLSALGDEPNLLEKERKIDLIRWVVSDELTAFDYFDMDAVLAYLVKVNIVHRWVSLDENYGREMFTKLMASLSARDLIPSE